MQSNTSTNQRKKPARAQAARKPKKQTEESNQQKQITNNRRNRQRQIAVLRGVPFSTKLSSDYAKALADPASYMCRVPDADTRRTALCQSEYDIPIVVAFNNLSTDGVFSACIQPILGKDGPNPDAFKVALTNINVDVDTDWSAPGSYQQLNGGYNIREDRYVTQLTGQPDFFFGVAGGTGTTAAAPFGTDPQLDPANYGSTLSAHWNTGGTPFEINGGPGTYHISIFFANATVVYALSSPGSQAALTPTAENFNGGVPGYFDQVLTSPVNWTLSISGSADPGTPALTITPVATLGASAWQNAGAVSALRPVAMSALFTSSLPALTNGGNIAAACVPSQTCGANFFENVAGGDVGQLQDWGALASVQGSYDGNLRDGCYTYWLPDDNTQLQFLSPETANQKSFPCLIVSGKMSPPSGAAGQYNVGRLKIVTTYEFTTNTRLWEMNSVLGSTATMEEAWRYLYRQPTAMPNGKHFDWLKSFFASILPAAATGARFIYDNRDTIGPLVGKAAALALV